METVPTTRRVCQGLYARVESRLRACQTELLPAPGAENNDTMAAMCLLSTPSVSAGPPEPSASGSDGVIVRELLLAAGIGAPEKSHLVTTQIRLTCSLTVRTGREAITASR